MTSVLEFKTSGERLRAIRAYCSPSRNHFCQLTGMSESTLKAWENDVAQLTKKGANSLVEIFSSFGLFCTANWLLDGEEPSPLRPFEGSASNTMSEEKFIEKEFDRLSQYYSDKLLLHKVPDQYMAPFFKQGDIVAGVLVSPTDLPYYWDEVILAETVNSPPLLRRVLRGSQPGLVTLVTLNIPGHQVQQRMEDITIKASYRIIWHRSPVHSQQHHRISVAPRAFG
jgi:transcriptional regulator with XRE-family HTH domain